MIAYGKNLKISPKKMLVIAEVIRGKKAADALKFLKFAPKKGARLAYKVVHSAVSNAKNNNAQKEDTLFVSEVIVTKGIVYKRGQPVSRGRMHSIKKRTSNLKIGLQVK